MGAVRKLFLIGPMGAGKTTVGKRLAQLLSLPFFDADHELERRTGVDIPYIFEKEGEVGFREREAQLIAELTQLPELVLATGGGVVLREDNRAALKARGCVIYLHAPVAQQVVRTAQSGKRPLLETGEPRAAILTRLFAQREPLYRATAELVIDTTGQNARKIADQILAALAARGEAHAVSDG